MFDIGVGILVVFSDLLLAATYIEHEQYAHDQRQFKTKQRSIKARCEITGD
jgi:hypothetical protein